MTEKMLRTKCSSCGFQFDEGIYLMKNKTDYICIFCLKSNHNLNITDLFDHRQKRILGEILDREGCVQLFADLI